MKKNFLIAILLLFSICSQSNHLITENTVTRHSINASIGSFNHENLLGETMGLETTSPFLQQISDSLCSISKDEVHFSCHFKMRCQSKYVATIQTTKEKKGSVPPKVIEVMNRIFKQYTIEEIYYLKRKEVEAHIFKELRTSLLKNHIQVDSILLAKIQFSEAIKKRIAERLLKEIQEEKKSTNSN